MITNARNTKAITTVPGWFERMQTSDKVTGTSQAYDLVPLVYRALQLRCNALTAIPYELKQGERIVDELPWRLTAGVRTLTLRRLLWITEAALLISGAAYWLGQSNRVRRVGVQWINPLTVTPQLINNNTELVFLQSTENRQNVFSQQDIAYFSEFNINNDVEPGQSAVGAALGDAQLLHFLKRYAGHFFEGGAVPITLLGVEGNPSPKELSRIESYFRRVASGVKNAFSVIGLSSAVKVQQITPPMSDLAIPDLKDSSVDSVADAFSLPLALLRDPNNRATADIHRASFYTETVIPRAKDLSETINQFLEPYGYTITFVPDQMDIFQADEANRSGSLLQIVQSLSAANQGGVSNDKLMVAFDVLGYDLTDEQRAVLEQQDEQPSEQPQEPPSFEFDEEEAKAADMALWQRKVTKRLKSGKSILADFDSDYLTDEERYKVIAALGHCDTTLQVSNFFAEGGYKAILGNSGDVDPERLAIENRFLNPLKRFLGGMAGRISSWVNGRGGGTQAPDAEFYKTEDDTFGAFLVPYVNDWAAFGVSQAATTLTAAQLGVDAQVNAKAAEWANRYGLDLAKGLNKTTASLVRVRLKSFIAEGKPASELASSLSKVIAPDWRAELIAQTEVTKAMAQGAIEVARDTPAIKSLVWLTLRDERVCPICGPLHQVSRKIEARYPGGYDAPPAHPRCRCNLGFRV